MGYSAYQRRNICYRLSNKSIQIVFSEEPEVIVGTHLGAKLAHRYQDVKQGTQACSSQSTYTMSLQTSKYVSKALNN